MEFLSHFFAVYGSLVNFIGINALLALSLYVTLSAGQLSLGNAAFAGIVHFVESGVEPPRPMPIRERTDGHRVEPGGAQHRRQALSRHAILKASIRPIDARISGGTAMPHHAGMDAVPSAHQGRARGQAGGVGAIIVLKAHTLSGNGIQVRRCVPVVSITPQVI
jgi:hypothetical protein